MKVNILKVRVMSYCDLVGLKTLQDPWLAQIPEKVTSVAAGHAHTLCLGGMKGLRALVLEQSADGSMELIRVFSLQRVALCGVLEVTKKGSLVRVPLMRSALHVNWKDYQVDLLW